MSADQNEFTGLKTMLEQFGASDQTPALAQTSTVKSEVLDQQEQIAATRKTKREQVTQDLAAIGNLRSEHISMTLHTRNAYLLFVGQAAGAGARITGATTASASLRSVWMLSANDNPLADYMLIYATEEAKKVAEELDEKITFLQKKMDAALDAGFEFDISGSANPLPVLLGYRSPYQFVIARLITKFDLCVRLVKTLNSLAVMNDSNARTEIMLAGRALRRYFQETTTACRVVLDERMRQLTRNDWVVMDSDAKAKERIDAAVTFLGAPIPSDVFTGARVPDYSRRRVRLSVQEIQLLSELADKAEIDARNLLNSLSAEEQED